MFFAWLASVMYGVNTVIGKLTSKHAISNPWFFNFFWNLFILVGTIPIALVYQVGMPADWTSVIIAGVFAFLTSTFYVLALYNLDVSIIGPLYNFRSAFAALIGAAFLGEALTGSQYFLIVVIFIAGIFLNVDEKLRFKAFFRSRNMFGVLAVFVSAIFGFTIKTSIVQNGFWETSLWMPIIVQILLLGTLPLFYKDLFVTPIKKYFGVIVAGFLNAAGDLAVNKAYAANVTISTAIISIPFSMIIAFIFSLFAPHLLEKHTPRVYAIRFLAALVMIIAALKLS